MDENEVSGPSPSATAMSSADADRAASRLAPDGLPALGGRTLAQFFFEIGYGACWADAYVAQGERPPFELTDAIIERAWAIAPDCHDDAGEFDRMKAMADAAPDLLDVLRDVMRPYSIYDQAVTATQGRPLICDAMLECGNHIRAAIAKAEGH